jgi:thiol-disulfide isomerase/thioredoxin
MRRNIPPDAVRAVYRCGTMNPLLVVALLVALVAVSTAVGLVWRATTGRSKTVSGSESVALSDLVAGEQGGRVATLLQFSTEFCSPCVATGVQLQRMAAAVTGVRHVEVDVTSRPDIASRFGILQSPTTLLLDRDGVIRARVGGAPRVAELRAQLDRVVSAATSGETS